MRRLVRQGWVDGQWADVTVNVDRGAVHDALPLGALDAAMVHSGRCAECRYAPLTPVDDLLVCKNCGATFKCTKDDTLELI